MPRSLKFKFGDTEFECSLHKVDRRKLYGSVDVATRDIDGNKCSLATLANDGKTLIPYGGTAMGYVNTDGQWVERGDLKPVGLDGQELKILESSFDITIDLDRTATVDEFLNYSARLVYVLGSVDELDPKFASELSGGKIFRFDFLYREGISSDPAFLLCTTDGIVWMTVGKPSAIDFVGLDQAAVCFVPKDDEEEVEDFDFEML